MTSTSDRAELVKFVCKGDAAAMRFCEAFVAWCHWIDDLIDKDKLWLPAAVTRVNLDMLLAFSDNIFFQRHKTSLMPLIVQSFRAFADSCEWEKREDVRDRRSADILKSNYHEVIWHVAFILGGWEHMQQVTARCRKWDYDFQG